MRGNLTVVLFGYPGLWFPIIHLTAIVCLTISTLASILVMSFMFSRTTGKSSFFKWPLAERLVIYLAITDFFFDTGHTLDHATVYLIEDHPPEPFCGLMAFSLQTFLLAQYMVVTFAAFNAYWLLVKGRRLELGRYDWRLLICTHGFPATVGGILLAANMLGPSGTWCLFDLSVPSGPILTTIYSTGSIAVFALDTGFYCMVWLTIQRNTRELHKITDKNEANSSKDKKQSKNKNNEVDVPASVAAKIKLMKRNAKVAKLFCLLVAASLCQWWPSIIYGIWMFFGDPPNVIILLTVIFVNSGGIFNGIAYTVMRFKSLNNENKKKQTMKGKMATSTSTVSTVT